VTYQADDDSFLTGGAAVRYKGKNSGKEIYLGIPSLGVGGNRVEAEYGGQSGAPDWADQMSHAVTFAFDTMANKVTTSVNSVVLLEYDFDLLLPPGCPIDAWNRMDILLRDNSSAVPNVEFNNVTLSFGAVMHELGDFAHSGSPTFQHWMVSGVDFSQEFTLSGDLVVDGPWANNEATRVEITVGCRNLFP
jgi:hypothetical protein